jgi:hypothetical protein
MTTQHLAVLPDDVQQQINALRTNLLKEIAAAKTELSNSPTVRSQVAIPPTDSTNVELEDVVVIPSGAPDAKEFTDQLAEAISVVEQQLTQPTTTVRAANALVKGTADLLNALGMLKIAKPQPRTSSSSMSIDTTETTLLLLQPQ